MSSGGKSLVEYLSSPAALSLGRPDLVLVVAGDTRFPTHRALVSALSHTLGDLLQEWGASKEVVLFPSAAPRRAGSDRVAEGPGTPPAAGPGGRSARPASGGTAGGHEAEAEAGKRAGPWKHAADFKESSMRQVDREKVWACRPNLLPPAACRPARVGAPDKLCPLPTPALCCCPGRLQLCLGGAGGWALLPVLPCCRPASSYSTTCANSCRPLGDRRPFPQQWHWLAALAIGT